MAGWDGKGAESHALAEIPVSSRQHGAVTVVTVAVQLGDARWMTLAVPIATADEGGGMAVSALPALVAGPHHAEWVPQQDTRPIDAAATEAARPSVTAFFTAYASGDQARLAGYVAPGSVIQGLGGQVSLGSLVMIRVNKSTGDVRQASATVAWHDQQSGATFEQGYRLALTQQNGKWLVASIAPAE